MFPRELEEARYENLTGCRRYKVVDPTKRLVARLRANWNSVEHGAGAGRPGHVRQAGGDS
jgi:hypothetical protein